MTKEIDYAQKDKELKIIGTSLWITSGALVFQAASHLASVAQVSEQTHNAIAEVEPLAAGLCFLVGLVAIDTALKPPH